MITPSHDLQAEWKFDHVECPDAAISSAHKRFRRLMTIVSACAVIGLILFPIANLSTGMEWTTQTSYKTRNF